MAKLLAFLRTAARGTARKRGSSTVAGGFEQLGVDNWLAERVASQGITTPTEVQNKVNWFSSMHLKVSVILRCAESPRVAYRSPCCGQC